MGLLSLGLYHRVRRDRQRFVTALNHMSQGLCVFDANARLILCNNRYLEMYGMSAAVVRSGCSLRDILEHRQPLTILSSWFFIHMIFALHYAHEFYGERGGKKSGLKFPDDEDPDYWDFVYFSFVIGMTAQVSDVAVTSKGIRQTVTAHAIVSFLFNVSLLALTINIAANVI